MHHERGTRAGATNDREQQDSGGANYYTAPTHQTTDQRQSMIQTAAYMRAEHRGFKGGNPVEDWLVAEREIDSQIRTHHTN